MQDLVLSQDYRPHLTQREMSQQVGISQISVNKIVKFDRRLKCFKKRRATELTQSNKLERSVAGASYCVSGGRRRTFFELATDSYVMNNL